MRNDFTKWIFIRIFEERSTFAEWPMERLLPHLQAADTTAMTSFRNLTLTFYGFPSSAHSHGFGRMRDFTGEESLEWLLLPEWWISRAPMQRIATQPPEEICSFTSIHWFPSCCQASIGVGRDCDQTVHSQRLHLILQQFFLGVDPSNVPCFWRIPLHWFQEQV